MERPAAMSSGPHSVVGRADLIAALDAAAEQAHHGHGSAICLLGPPGIGKTAISESFCAGVDPATVITGRCAPPPARPLRLLSELAVGAVMAGAELEPVQETVFGAGVRVLLGDGPVAEQVRPAPVIGEGLRLLLSQLDGLVVCAIEDLHWADDDTLMVVDDLLEHVDGSPVLFVLTSRVHVSDDADRLIAEWGRRAAAQLVTVPPLATNEIVEVVQRVAGDAIGDDQIRRIASVCDGSPLLAEAFARDARDLGPGRHPARLPPPGSYQAAVERRLGDLDPTTRRDVGLVALTGRNFDPDLLRLCGLPAERVEAAAAAVVRAQLADPAQIGRPTRFHHDLTRDAVVASLDGAQRRLLAGDALDAMLEHELDADALEAAAGLASAAGDDGRAVELLIEAARRALSIGATGTALSRLDLATGLRDAEVLHGPVLNELRLEALALAGRAADALAVGEVLLADRAFTEEPSRSHRLLLALARASGSLGDWSAAARRLDTAMAIDPPPEIQSYRAVIAMELGDVEDASERAHDVLERLDPPAVAVCEAREVLGRVARERSYPEAADQFRAGVAAATSAGLDLWRARSLLELGLCEATIYGKPDVFEEASRSARQIGAVGLSAMCDYNLANLYGLTVHPTDALIAAERGVASARQVEVPILQGLCWVAAGQARALLGESGEARIAADRARAAAPASAEVEAMALGMCQALDSMLRGELDQAADLFGASLAALRSLPVVTATAPWYLGPVVLAIVGHPLLEDVRDQLREASFQAVPTIATISHLVDAISTGRDRGAAAAAPHLERLRQEQSRYRWFTSRGTGMWALLEGTACVAAIRDGWGEPAPTLEAAQRTLENAGVTHTARWFGSLLRDLGVAPRRRGRARSEVPPAFAHYGLTARECEVLALMHGRPTNREIAARLVIAPSTVKTHVERLLAKTGRKNRGELAELAATVARSDPSG